MTKKMLSVFLAFIVLQLLTYNASANTSFVDVPTSHGAHEEITFLVNQNIISGYTEKNQKLFKPNNNVTRGQAIKMVVLAAGYTPVKKTTSTFSDVQVGTELSSYVESAIENGIISKSNVLKPNEPIARDEMSKLLALAFQLDVMLYETAPLPFKDIELTNSYYKYIAAIYYNGITKGNTTGTAYNATEHVKRSQFASFVARAMSEQYRLPLPTYKVETPDTAKVLKQVYVTTADLNVRTTPTSAVSTNIVGKVNINEKLDVYEEKDGWSKVNYQGRFAYVASKYTSATSPLETISKPEQPVEDNKEQVIVEEPVQQIEPPITSQTSVKGIATVNKLAVRAQASSSSKQLLQINQGKEVAVHSINGYWANVTVDGVTGFIHKSYLRLINTTGTPVAGRIIVLDAGHGGKDSGAIFKYADGSKALEKDVVLKTVQVLRQKLEQAGATVKLTRSTDVFIELQDRVAFAQKQAAEMFVSVHVNAVNNTTASGTETFHSKYTNVENVKEDATLAKAINEEIVKNAQMKDRGVKREDYYVIAGLVMPAVLVELGFISNESDRNKLMSDAYIEIYAQSIYNGIVKYYSK